MEGKKQAGDRLPCSIQLIPTNFQKIAFCDGSSYWSDHHEECYVQYAAWSAWDCTFVCKREAVKRMEKSEQIKYAELKAFKLALTFSPRPELIYTDSMSVVKQYPIVGSSRTVWCPRNRNKIADFLASGKAGAGYIVFNATLPVRNWLFLHYISN